MRNPFRRDLVLVHPPAIYDFRSRDAFRGPVADAVPSTTMFEMYPVGMTSIAAFLERNHYNVQIVNLAYRMLHEPSLDVPACLAAIDAPVIGLDLHWLPHAQGTLAVAALLKTLHPATKHTRRRAVGQLLPRRARAPCRYRFRHSRRFDGGAGPTAAAGAS